MEIQSVETQVFDLKKAANLAPIEIPLYIYKNSDALRLDKTAPQAAVQVVASITGNGVSYRFDESFYMQELRIITADGSKAPEKAELDVLTFGKSVNILPASESRTEQTTFAVNEFVMGFTLKSTQLINLFPEKFSGVLVIGWDLRQISNGVHNLTGFNARLLKIEHDVKAAKDAISARELKLAESMNAFASYSKAKEGEIAHREQQCRDQEVKSKTTLAIQTESIEKNRFHQKEEEQKLSDLRALIKTNEETTSLQVAKLEFLQKQQSEAEHRITLLKGETKSKTEEALSAAQRLRALQSENSLYADDLLSFGKQARNQALIYYGAAITALFAVCYVGGQVTTQVGELLRLYIERPTLNIWSLLILKAPFTSIVIATLASLFWLIKECFSKIAIIHTERRELSKIGVLSREFSIDGANGLNVTDSEIYNQRMNLRKSTIQDFMAGRLRGTQDQRIILKQNNSVVDNTRAT